MSKQKKEIKVQIEKGFKSPKRNKKEIKVQRELKVQKEIKGK